MRIPPLTHLLLLGLILSESACHCGEPNPTSRSTAFDTNSSATSAQRDTWDRKAFDVLLAGLPKSKVDTLLDAVPRDLPWRAYSEDPSSWLRHVRSKEGYRAFAETPLAAELRSQGPWLTVESMRKQVMGLTSFVGGSQDDDGLWQGAVALGTRTIEEDRPAFVVVKRVLPEIQVVARFVAAFASVGLDTPDSSNETPNSNERDRPKLSIEKIGEVSLHTLHRADANLYFALFRDILIFGSDKALVKSATRIAAGEEQPQNEVHAKLWPAPGAPGVHIAWRAPQDGPLGLFAIDALGLTLDVNDEVPFSLRVQGGAPPSPNATSLLRYAPGTTFCAWVDGRKPAKDFLEEVRRRVVSASGQVPWAATKINEIEATIVSQLDGGIAFWFSNDANQVNNPSARGVVAFRHANKEELEPAVRALLAELTARKVERNILEPVGNAFLLTTGDDGPAAALSDDALLVALSPAPLRDALHAATGKSRSILDAEKMNATTQASHALFLDMGQGSVFLRNFYRSAFEKRAAPSWKEAGPLLEPTFSAFAKGGAYFGELQSKEGEVFAGGIHALP